MKKPFVPFYKPYGMTDEEYEYEVKIAKHKLAEWEAEQEEIEDQVCSACHYPDDEEPIDDINPRPLDGVDFNDDTLTDSQRKMIEKDNKNDFKANS